MKILYRVAIAATALTLPLSLGGNSGASTPKHLRPFGYSCVPAPPQLVYGANGGSAFWTPRCTETSSTIVYQDGYMEGNYRYANAPLLPARVACADTPRSQVSPRDIANNLALAWFLKGCEARFNQVWVASNPPAPTTPLSANAGPPNFTPSGQGGAWQPAPQSLITAMNRFNTTHGYATGGVTVGNSWISQDTANPSYYLFVEVAGQQNYGGFAERTGSSWKTSGPGMNGWTCTTLVPASVFADFGMPACTEPGFNS